MGLIKSEGIVLSSKKYSETSLILHVYTLSDGMRSMIVSGVRKSRSKNQAAIYQIPYILQLVFYANNRDKLERIKEASLSIHYQHINRDVVKSSIATLMIEIFRNSIYEKESNPSYYGFLKSSLLHVDQCTESLANYPLKFLLSFSQVLGFRPMDNWNESCPIFDTYEGSFVSLDQSNSYCLTPEASASLFKLLKEDYESIHQIIINRLERAYLIDKLIQYYKLHLENFKELKSLSILRQVLS